MRDRLVELIKQANKKCYSTTKCEDCSAVDTGDQPDDCLKYNIADHLLANGVIVPPCKVGDTVYQPSYKFTKCSAYDYTPKYVEDSSCVGCGATCDSVKKPYIYKGEVVSIRITKEQIFLAVSFQEKFDSSRFILGKTVFLTREEAEPALKGEHNAEIH